MLPTLHAAGSLVHKGEPLCAEPAASWNVAPTQAAMAVRVNPETNGKLLDLLQWGLVPYFTKDLKAARKPIDARAETVASSACSAARWSAADTLCMRLLSTSSARCRMGSSPNAICNRPEG